jgi:hypothetical protein
MKYFMNSKFRLLLLGFVIGLIIGSARAKADYVIGEPINLGTTINSSAKDFNLNISADGLTLFLHLPIPAGTVVATRRDCFRSTGADGAVYGPRLLPRMEKCCWPSQLQKSQEQA